MLANGVRSDNQDFTELAFEVEIKTAEGGDAANVVSFLHAKGAYAEAYRLHFGYWMEAERKQPQSVLGELSELPDISQLVQERVWPDTAVRVVPFAVSKLTWRSGARLTKVGWAPATGAICNIQPENRVQRFHQSEWQLTSYLVRQSISYSIRQEYLGASDFPIRLLGRLLLVVGVTINW